MERIHSQQKHQSLEARDEEKDDERKCAYRGEYDVSMILIDRSDFLERNGNSYIHPSKSSKSSGVNQTSLSILPSSSHASASVSSSRSNPRRKRTRESTTTTTTTTVMSDIELNESETEDSITNTIDSQTQRPKKRQRQDATDQPQHKSTRTAKSRSSHPFASSSDEIKRKSRSSGTNGKKRGRDSSRVPRIVDFDLDDVEEDDDDSDDGEGEDQDQDDDESNDDDDTLDDTPFDPSESESSTDEEDQDEDDSAWKPGSSKVKPKQKSKKSKKQLGKAASDKPSKPLDVLGPSVMDLLHAPSVGLDVQIHIAGALLAMPGFSINTVDSNGRRFLYLLYSVYSVFGAGRKQSRSIHVHKEELMRMLSEDADLSRTDLDGRNFLHCITDTATYSHRISFSQWTGYGRYHYRRQCRVAKRDGTAASADFITSVQAQNKSFVSQCLKLCIRAKMDFMQPDKNGHRPLHGLIKCITAGIFDLSGWLSVFSTRNCTRINLSTRDGDGKTAMDLILGGNFETFGKHVIRALVDLPKLLVQIDPYDVDTNGQTIVDRIRNGSFRGDRIDERLEMAWVKAVMPTIHTSLDRHMIHDLSVICGEFLSGGKSSSRSGVDVDLDFVSGAPAAPSDGVSPMQLD